MSLFRITESLLQSIHADLDRPHPFAGERVGFLSCGVATLPDNSFGIYAASYHPVLDEDYVEDHRAAAMLGPEAFRKMLQRIYHRPASIFHVHRHEHHGSPAPSGIDSSESRRFIPDFWKVCPGHPHGALILSLDSMSGQLWHPNRQSILPFDAYSVVGDAIRITRKVDERA